MVSFNPPSPPGAVSSGDIDILLAHPDYTSESTDKPSHVKRIVESLESGGFVTDTLSLGESKFMVSGNLTIPGHQHMQRKDWPSCARPIIPLRSRLCNV